MRKRKGLLALLLVLSMCVSMTVIPAAAADEEGAATIPQLGEEETPPVGKVASTGEANVVWSGVNPKTITGDDDSDAAAVDTITGDIYVWAQVKETNTKVYKVDIAWGAMMFEYSTEGGAWDVTEHEYLGGDAAGWNTDQYVNGANNKITITNHSNGSIDAVFAYAHNTTNKFNGTGAGDPVQGKFYADNQNAVNAASKSEATELTDSKITVGSAEDAENPTEVKGAEKTGAVFFTFSGIPDEGTGANLGSFDKVGVITVTISATPSTESAE